METALIGLIGTVFVALTGFIQHRITTRTEKEQTVGDQYKDLVSEIKTWSQDQLAARDEQIESLQGQTESLRADVAELKNAVELWKSKFWTAAKHITILRAGHPDPPAIPSDIADEVK